MFRENLGAIIVVLATVLNKAPPVYIANVANKGVALLDAEQIETAHLLLEDNDDAPSNLLFAEGKDDGEADFFAI